jgi:glycosyltransferase involved in cell wall biosynthesis
MEIHQLLPGFQHGDAISNHALALARLLRAWGHEAALFARYRGPKTADDCFPLDAFANTRPDVTLYHYSIGADEVTEQFLEAQGKRVLIYHNITPHTFFARYSTREFQVTRRGREALHALRDVVDMTLADSRFNCEELLAAGFRNPRVLPILVDFARFERVTPCPLTRARCADGWVNFLFVGRLAPNKCQHDVIRVFAHYNRHIERRSRLLLVGGAPAGRGYFAELRRLVRKLGLEDHVVFAGHVPFAELAAYYQSAQVFLCLSEHEGFCVPVLEAFHQGVPVIAYEAAAVPHTLGGAGILVRSKDEALIAELAHVLVTDRGVRDAILQRQTQRVRDFDPARTAERFQAFLAEIGVSAPARSDGPRRPSVRPVLTGAGLRPG